MAKSFVEIMSFPDAKPDFKAVVLDRLWNIYYWSKGKSLLETITKKAGGLWTTKLEIVFQENRCDYRGTGTTGAILYFDPLKGTGRDFFEPTQSAIIAQNKFYVYLYHELVHFLHDLEGTFSGTCEEEWRTTGLYEYKNEEYSENSLRFEMKLPRRPCYYFVKTATNILGFERERLKRDALGRPSQDTLTPMSEECKWETAAVPPAAQTAP